MSYLLQPYVSVREPFEVFYVDLLRIVDGHKPYGFESKKSWRKLPYQIRVKPKVPYAIEYKTVGFRTKAIPVSAKMKKMLAKLQQLKKEIAADTTT